MKILAFQSFNESKKDKFPNVKKMDIDGFTVYMGKDAKSNDYLTFNMSDNNDIWMHAKGVPGSHLLIVVHDNLPTENVIRQVAKLAKANSKGKNFDTQEILYCKKKFVKKNAGMNDGQVSVDYKNANIIII